MLPFFFMVQWNYPPCKGRGNIGATSRVKETVTAFRPRKTIMPEEATPSAATNPLRNRAVFVFSLMGMMVAGYLWQLHSHPMDIPCGGSHGCERVANSPYSRFPIGSGPPVALYGTLGYLALTALAFLRTLPGMAAKDGLLLRVMALCAGLGTVASLYLTAMELFVIHAICRWCIASQVIMLLVAVLVALDWLASRKQNKNLISETTNL